jgi:hypothetical protein
MLTAYYLPTYGLIKRYCFPKFSEQLIAYNIPLILTGATKKYIPLTDLLEKYDIDSIIGYEVGYSLIDETDIQVRIKWQRYL